MVTTWVALLRGINVGGKNPVPMKDLKVVFEGLGYSGVATYIQSGNVLFRAAKDEDELAAQIPQAIAQRFKLSIPVVLRTAKELAKVVSSNPFLERGKAPDEALLPILAVGYLGRSPEAASVAKLDPKVSAPDEFRVLGREVFMKCPNTLGRTRLTVDLFEKALGTAVTFRNWRTATTLADWAREGG